MKWTGVRPGGLVGTLRLTGEPFIMTYEVVVSVFDLTFFPEMLL